MIDHMSVTSSVVLLAEYWSAARARQQRCQTRELRKGAGLWFYTNGELRIIGYREMFGVRIYFVKSRMRFERFGN